MSNEKRLIDAVRYGEVLERYINAPHVKVFGKYSDGMQLAINTCIELLNSQRTVDAVEVVRCKDCKHRGEEVECPMYFVKKIEWDDDGYTEYDYVPYDHTVDDGFCDRGERGEGE